MVQKFESAMLDLNFYFVSWQKDLRETGKSAGEEFGGLRKKLGFFRRRVEKKARKSVRF